MFIFFSCFKSDKNKIYRLLEKKIMLCLKAIYAEFTNTNLLCINNNNKIESGFKIKMTLLIIFNYKKEIFMNFIMS